VAQRRKRPGIDRGSAVHRQRQQRTAHQIDEGGVPAHFAEQLPSPHRHVEVLAHPENVERSVKHGFTLRREGRAGKGPTSPAQRVGQAAWGRWTGGKLVA
jgi:hypothetical protein